MELKATELMHKHWAFKRAHNQEPTPIFAVVHGPGSIQPENYIQGWVIKRSEAKKMQQRIADHCAQFGGAVTFIHKFEVAI